MIPLIYVIFVLQSEKFVPQKLLYFFTTLPLVPQVDPDHDLEDCVIKISVGGLIEISKLFLNKQTLKNPYRNVIIH